MAKHTIFYNKRNGSEPDVKDQQNVRKRIERSLKPLRNKFEIEVQ